MINKVTLIGNLGADPEIRTLETGQQVCSFSVATSDDYKDKNGEWQNVTDWHRIVIWGDLAKRTFDRVKKGHKVYLEGKIKTRKYQDKQGNDRYTTDIVCRVCRSLEKSDSNGGVMGSIASNVPPELKETRAKEGEFIDPIISGDAEKEMPF